MIDLSKAAQTAWGRKCNKIRGAMVYLSKWVRTFASRTHEEKRNVEHLGVMVQQGGASPIVSIVLRPPGAIVAHGENFHKGDEGKVRSRPGGVERSIRSETWWLGGFAGGRFAKQPVSRYQDTKYVQYLPRASHAFRQGRLAGWWSSSSASPGQLPRRAWNARMGVVPLWYGRANQDAIKISSRLLVGPESKLQWLWPQLHRRFCGFLSQHGAN